MYTLWIFDSTMSGVSDDSSKLCFSLTEMRPVGACSTLAVVSVPPGVNRGFRNVGTGTGHLLVVLGGTDPGRVAWVDNVMSAVREKGFDLDERGKIVGGAVA